MSATRRTRLVIVLSLAAGMAGACSEPINAPDGKTFTPRFGKAATGVTVQAAAPSAAPQNVTLDVQISGNGFVAGSTAEWLLAGQPDSRVKTNSTRFISPTSLVANVTISPDAVPSRYDISVTTPQGKKGIGTEVFTVLPMEQLVTPSGTSNATGVNSSGVIAGYRSGGCDSGVLPSVWLDPTTRIDLPLPAGYCRGVATKVNDAGVVLGRVDPPSSSTGRAVRWVQGQDGYVPSLLGSMPGGGAQLVGGLNNSGNAVYHQTGGTAPGIIRSALWWSEASGLTVLALPAGNSICVADDLNDLDQIAGACGPSPFMPVVWDSPSAAPSILPTLPGYNYGGEVRSLNNTGIATGTVSNKLKSGKIVQTGVRWTRAGTSWQVEALPDLGGGESLPLHVNGDGWIVGRSTVSASQYRGALWMPGAPVVNLGGFGPGSIAYQITPAGAAQRLIVGQSAVGGDSRAVVWRP